MTITTGSEPAALMGGGKNWMAGAVKHPGGLHRALHVPEGDTIPKAKIAKAANSDDAHLARMAHLAQAFAHHRAGGRAHHP